MTNSNPKQQQRISLCTMCRHKNEACKAGYQLLERLNLALTSAGDVITDDFEITGTATLDGCNQGCTVAWLGSLQGCYLFGDIDAGEDVTELMHYLTKSCDNNGLQVKAASHLTKIPAAMIVTQPLGQTLH